MSTLFKKTLSAATLALIAGTASAASVDLLFVNNSGELELDTSYTDTAGRQLESFGYATALCSSITAPAPVFMPSVSNWPRTTRAAAAATRPIRKAASASVRTSCCKACSPPASATR
ncbi:MAG: hypothetical protein O9341_02335 [Paucibacter sp.]|nr:hypothetical protein [Roseateles sp.]